MTIEKAFTLKPSLQFKNAAILHITGKMHIAMHSLYHCGCCGTGKAELAADNNRFNKVNKAFDKAIEAIHTNGGFEAKDLLQKPINNLTKETFAALKDAVDTGVTQVVPPTMKTALEKNVFFFSGLKTYVSMKEASALLVDEKGNIKPLHQFKQDVLAINSKYNQNYLEAEHGFAVRSAQMAAKWVQFQKDGDRYDLQFRTANDGKVRPAHAKLHNITLPISDPFWLSYWCPLGWRCRCNIVQVRKGKYEVTDSATASQLGEDATTIIGADGTNKAEIFRGNSGAQERIFPENHPYAKLTPKAAIAIIEKQANDYLPNKRKQEYEILKADKNYTDVAFKTENGGLKATHILHNFHPKTGIYEKQARDILFEAGDKIILAKEKAGEGEKIKDGVKHVDGFVNDLPIDISTILGDAKNTIKRALQHCQSKNAEVAVLYFPNEALYSDERFATGVKMFNGNTTFRFKQIIIIKGGKVYKKSHQ